MEKKTRKTSLLEVYDETIQSLVIQEVNIELYKELPPDENIVPKELIDAGQRDPKTALQRITEIREIIDTKKRTLKIVDKLLAEEEGKKDDDSGETGE